MEFTLLFFFPLVIHFTLTGLTLGWIAAGINTAPSMLGADIWWCRYKNGTGVVVRRRSSSRFVMMTSSLTSNINNEKEVIVVGSSLRR